MFSSFLINFSSLKILAFLAQKLIFWPKSDFFLVDVFKNRKINQ